MFVCGNCLKITAPGQPMTRTVVEVREVEYRNEGRVSRGTEIVREVGVGPCCGGKERIEALSGADLRNAVFRVTERHASSL